MMGKGERFLEEYYFEVKPFIKINGKTIIEQVIEPFLGNHENIYIACNSYSKKKLEKLFPPNTIKIIELQYSSGAAHTIYQSLDYIDDKSLPLFCIDCDTIIDKKVLGMIPQSGNYIASFVESERSGVFSYLEIKKNKISNIVEKKAISEIANAGIYVFSSIDKLKNYCTESFEREGEKFLSHVVSCAIKHKEVFKNVDITGCFKCVGTPKQLIDFCDLNIIKGKIFCFDIDKTLVHDLFKCPIAIKENVDFCNKIYKNGGHIILFSSRGMVSTNKNIEYIEKEIRPKIEKILLDLKINYHELILGKPYADYYIDDKAVSAFSDLQKEIGFYFDSFLKARYHHNLKKQGDFVIKKGELSNESYYYNNILSCIKKKFFPKVISAKEDEIIMNMVYKKTYSDLFLSGKLKDNHIISLLNSLKEIHSNFSESVSDWGYIEKVYERFNSDKELYKELGINKKNIDKDIKNIKSIDSSIIHGDPVFTNVFEDLVFIDPRGSWDNKQSIFGDKHYDYAKVYQSICGYDFYLNNQTPKLNYIKKLKKTFEDWYNLNYGDHGIEQLKSKTRLLIISMLPLHKEDINRCKRFLKLLNNIK